MRDFERDILNAGRFDGVVPASEFSWSHTRQQLFLRCERAYFIRYYLAQGGWDPHAHEFYRSAYMEKYNIPFQLWLVRTFQDSLHRALLDSAAAAPEMRKRIFLSSIPRRLSKAVFDLQYSLENQEFRADPKRPSIQECADSPDPAKAFCEWKPKAVAAFAGAYAAFVHSELFREILTLNFTDFRPDDRFLTYQIDSLPVWFTPGFVYFNKTRITMICGVAPGSDAGRISAALFTLYVRAKWKRHTVAAFALPLAGETNLTPIEPYPGIRAHIRAGAREMLSRIRADGKAHLEDFPCASEEKQACCGCSFSRTCRKLAEWQK